MSGVEHHLPEVATVRQLDRAVDPPAVLVPAVADDLDRISGRKERLREVAGVLARLRRQLRRVDAVDADACVNGQVEADIELHVHGVAVVDLFDDAAVRAEGISGYGHGRIVRLGPDLVKQAKGGGSGRSLNLMAGGKTVDILSV